MSSPTGCLSSRSKKPKDCQPAGRQAVSVRWRGYRHGVDVSGRAVIVWRNRRRPTSTPSTAIAFSASRIAANSLRHNAFGTDPEAPTRLRAASSTLCNSSPLPFSAARVRTPATPLSVLIHPRPNAYPLTVSVRWSRYVGRGPGFDIRSRRSQDAWRCASGLDRGRWLGVTSKTAGTAGQVGTPLSPSRRKR